MLFCNSYKSVLIRYNSCNDNRVIKSRRMRWPGHVTRMEEMRNACRAALIAFVQPVNLTLK
jgi:hypothetical protein